MTALVELATGTDAAGEPLDDSANAARHAIALAREHRPEVMTLERKHDLSLAALDNVREATLALYGVIVDVMESKWPDRWRDVRPCLLTAASWVGYDFDGRSDVGWIDTFHKRLKDQAACLQTVRAEVDAICAMAENESESEGIRASLSDLAALIGQDPATVRERVREIAPQVVDGAARRLSDPGSGLGHHPQRALESAEAQPVGRRLFALRAVLNNSGLGMARVHVRLNASQLHNALRATVGLDHPPDDPRYRVSYLDRPNALLDRVEPVSINFGSILSEPASATRLFMVVAQMLKHIDPVTPVRFLIFECEIAFTVLAALHLARQFGVDDRIDISPLFETQRALEAGSRLIDQLLDNPHYRAYVVARGRLSVETGYSDAGRYIGQIPVAASIERFRSRLSAVLRKHDLNDVQLMIFDTHGESVGRRAHPAGFPDRLDCVNMRATRRAFAEAGVDLKEEVSFQGGDGYLHFGTPDAALATPAGGDAKFADDPFHAEADYIREAFTTITEFQRDLMNDGDYTALLGPLRLRSCIPPAAAPWCASAREARP